MLASPRGGMMLASREMSARRPPRRGSRAGGQQHDVRGFECHPGPPSLGERRSVDPRSARGSQAAHHALSRTCPRWGGRSGRRRPWNDSQDGGVRGRPGRSAAKVEPASAAASPAAMTPSASARRASRARQHPDAGEGEHHAVFEARPCSPAPPATVAVVSPGSAEDDEVGGRGCSSATQAAFDRGDVGEGKPLSIPARVASLAASVPELGGVQPGPLEQGQLRAAEPLGAEEGAAARSSGSRRRISSASSR